MLVEFLSLRLRFDFAPQASNSKKQFESKMTALIDPKGKIFEIESREQTGASKSFLLRSGAWFFG